MSNRMLLEMKRHNYVTPTNYLELVSGYQRLDRVTFSPIYNDQISNVHLIMSDQMWDLSGPYIIIVKFFRKENVL